MDVDKAAPHPEINVIGLLIDAAGQDAAKIANEDVVDIRLDRFLEALADMATNPSSY